MERRKAGNILVVVLCIVAMILVVIFGPWVYEMNKNPYNDARFERTTWLASASSWDSKNPRGPMADDVRRNYLRIGMPKKAVRKLLGKSNNSQHNEQQNEDHYFIGNWGYMSIDGDFLIIHYNKAKKLDSSEIYSH